MDNISDVLIIMFAVGLGLAFIIANIFFSISLYKGLKRIPPEKLLFPAWFVWMFFVPVVGYVFYWLMLPFGVPRSFREAVPDNPAAQKRASTLFGLGLAQCILLIVALNSYVILFLGLPWLIVWILYWLKAVEFRKLYLT